MWHSCGRFRLEDLCARSSPEVLALARRYVRLLRSLGDVQVLPQRTRLVCVARVRFAGMTPRRDHIVVAFALRRRVRSARIARIESYGPRWQSHQVPVRRPAELDAELTAWLRESHDVVGTQAPWSPPTRRGRRARAERR